MLLVMLGAPALGGADAGAARRLPGAGRRLGADRPRLRGRRDRRLAVDLALAARAEPGARGALLRDRQRARGAAGGAGRRRDRRRPGRLRAAAPPRRCAVAFLAIGLLAAFVFAAGRFGADVGAAIVFPVGAAVAAAAIAARRRRAALLVVAAPFAVLALLALIDLVSGANAHLTRSVLDAGGLGDLADVAQRRLQLSAHSFARPIVFVFLPLVAALAALAVAAPRPPRAPGSSGCPALRAGLIGAVAATVVGTLANDSGALLLEIGTAYLLVFAGFAWAESAPATAEAGR